MRKKRHINNGLPKIITDRRKTERTNRIAKGQKDGLADDNQYTLRWRDDDWFKPNEMLNA